jgi:hypothetical protein
VDRYLSDEICRHESKPLSVLASNYLLRFFPSIAHGAKLVLL